MFRQSNLELQKKVAYTWTFAALGAGLINQYKSGIVNITSRVDNASPPIMHTAISIKKASEISGVIPKMVVPAAKITGRKRLIEARVIAS